MRPSYCPGEREIGLGGGGGLCRSLSTTKITIITPNDTFQQLQSTSSHGQILDRPIPVSLSMSTKEKATKKKEIKIILPYFQCRFFPVAMHAIVRLVRTAVNILQKKKKRRINFRCGMKPCIAHCGFPMHPFSSAARISTGPACAKPQRVMERDGGVRKKRRKLGRPRTGRRTQTRATKNRKTRRVPSVTYLETKFWVAWKI